MKLRGYFARLKNESCEEREHIHTYVHTLTHKDFCTECINPNCTVVFYTLQNCTFSSMEAGERTNEGSPQCKFCHILFFSLRK